MVKNPSASEGDIRDLDLIPGQENLQEKETATLSSILAWEIHGQRSLLGYSPRDLKELDARRQ